MTIIKRFPWIPIAILAAALSIALLCPGGVHGVRADIPSGSDGDGLPDAPYMDACAQLPDWTDDDYRELYASYKYADDSWLGSSCLGRCGDPGSTGEGICSCDPAS